MRESPEQVPSINANDPRRFLNRELNWLQFNRRALEQACDPLWWQPASSVAVFLRLELTYAGSHCTADRLSGTCTVVRVDEHIRDCG